MGLCLFILVKGVLGGWLTMCPVLFLLSFSFLMTFECVRAGGSTFPAGAQLHGEERERGLLHQGHFCIFFTNFVFENKKTRIFGLDRKVVPLL